MLKRVKNENRRMNYDSEAKAAQPFMIDINKTENI
jgi:hypothetical protein